MTLVPPPLSDIPAYRQYAMQEAGAAGLNVDLFLATIDCENPKWDTILQSRVIHADGTREQSWGIVQINLAPNAHPEVTKKQATDPHWSIDWMVAQWKAGRAWQWTCYNTIVKAAAPL